MSPAAEKQKTAQDRSGKLGGKDFEETFKPKGTTVKELEEPKGKKKKKKSGPKVLIIIIIIILLLAGSAAALYFSGNLNNVLSMVGLAPSTPSQSIEEQQAALDQKAAELDAKAQELDKLQLKLDAQQAALESASAAPSASPTFEAILSGFSEEKLKELKQVGAIYSKMDPAAAAAIMLGIYDSTQIAVIVYFMQPAASALLLAKLDPSLAGDVTKIMTV
jgi:flagellar motility protein MotE (MotC chaperone)